MKKTFTEYMFMMTILIIILDYLISYLLGEEQFYGVNKTVGWAYDISNQIFYIAILFSFSKILFFIGYLIVFLLRRKTNFTMSIAHISLILLTILSIYLQNFFTSTIFCLLSMVLFSINIYRSHR